MKLVSQLDREATDNAKTNIVNQRKNDRISELYTEWTEDGDVSVDSEVLAKITFDYHLVLPEEEPETSVAEETEAISEAKTEAGTEASTEVKTEETEASTEAKTEADTKAAETETEAAATEASAKVAETETETEEVQTESETSAKKKVVK